MIDLPWCLRNLLNYSLQLGILIGTAVFLEKLFPLRLPRLSYAFWRILLLACLVLPLFEPWPAPPQFSLSGSKVVVIDDLSASQLQGGSPASPEWHIPYLPLVAELLIAGMLFRLSRLLVGALSLRRALKRARPIALPWNMSQLAPVSGSQPRVCCVDSVNGPATYGLFRPVILLPGSFPDLTETQQLGVLCHELRHVQRRVWLFRLVEEIVRCLFWFHPLVLWLTQRIELSREQSVDQEVVQMLGRSRDYLESLLEMASARVSGPVAALFLSESYLRQRVRIIKEGFTMSTRRLSLSLTMSVVILLTAGSLAVWAFPLQGREQDQGRPAGLPGGSGIESQKRGPEAVTDGNSEPVKVGGNVQRSKLIHWVRPEYPPDAEKAGIKGMVLLKVTISEAGDVAQAEVIRGHPMLLDAAVAAARQWKFSPTLLDGRAVPVIATQTVSFPPVTGPESLTANTFPPDTFPFVDRDKTANLRLDESGSFWSGAKRLEGSDLIQALEGKEAVVLTALPASQPSPEAIEKAMKILQTSTRLPVQFVSSSYQFTDGKLIPYPTSVFPVTPLMKAGRLLGYGQFRLLIKEDGRPAVSQQGLITDAMGQPADTARYNRNSDSWTITATYRLTLDSERRITAVDPVSSSIPELEEVVATMIGRIYRGSSLSSNLELEIALR